MRVSSRAAAILAVLVLSAFGFAACGGDDSGGGGSTSDSSSSGGNTDASVGYASPVATQPNQVDIDEGMKRAAEQFGWSFDTLDADLSPDKQVSDIDTFISKGMNGISFWALDPGSLNAAFERASKEGVPLVGLNSEAEFVNTNIEWDRYACEDGGTHDKSVDYIQERKGDNARILVIGPPPVGILLKDTQCFQDRAKAAGLEVVDREDNVDDSVASATPIVSDLLNKNKDIDAIWSYNDTTALGAGAAIESADESVFSPDNEDGIVTIGGNADVEAIDAIKAGRLTATWDSLSAETGAAAMMAMAPVVNDGADPSSMPKQIIVDTVLYDASNVDDYVAPSDRELDLDNLPITIQK